MGQCKAEYHSLDGKDSLCHSSHTLFCTAEEGHDGWHVFMGGYTSLLDDRVDCECPRCRGEI